jgi:sarcosine oxidase gamma subunit
VISYADGRQVVPESTVNGPELLIRRLPAGPASLLRLHGEHLGPATDRLDRHLAGTVRGRTAVRGPRAFALSEVEWLLIDYPRESVRRSLRLLGRALVQLSDVSGSLVSFGIEGPASRSVLGIDGDRIWSGAAQNSGEYAHTRLGGIALIVQCTGRESFELHTERDPLGHLESWIRRRCMTRLLPLHPRCQ